MEGNLTLGCWYFLTVSSRLHIKPMFKQASGEYNCWTIDYYNSDGGTMPKIRKSRWWAAEAIPIYDQETIDRLETVLLTSQI